MEDEEEILNRDSRMSTKWYLSILYKYKLQSVQSDERQKNNKKKKETTTTKRNKKHLNDLFSALEKNQLNSDDMESFQKNDNGDKNNNRFEKESIRLFLDENRTEDGDEGK